MTKQFLFVLIFPFLVLAGCQPLPVLNTGTAEPNCFLPEAAVSQFLEDEHLYMTANPTQQKQILRDVKGTSERLANLLSSTGNDQTSLKKSLSLFNQLPLLPNKLCVADRYLYLRLRHTQAQLRIIEELNVATTRLNTAKVTIETQQQQIDALTQIEQAITRQREDP